MASAAGSATVVSSPASAAATGSPGSFRDGLLGGGLGNRRLRAGKRQDLVLDALGRQRQAPALGVDLEDLHADLIARMDDLARVLDVVAGELGDVHEPLDAVEDLDERAEGDDLRDLARELVVRRCRCP